MANCRVEECPLYGKREVPYQGRRDAPVVLVGESPGNKECMKGVPFYEEADAGKMLRSLADLAGLDFDLVFLMNSARCMIVKDDMSEKQIGQVLACCRRHVVAGLQAMKPRAIIVAGNIALQQVLKRSGIKKARGEWVWSEEFNCWVMPTFHPAYICRTQALGKLVVGDLKQVVQFLENGNQPELLEADLKYIDVQSIRPLLVKAEKEEISVGLDSESQGIDWMDPNFLCISYSISFRHGTGVQVILFEECSQEESEFTIQWLRAPEGKKKKVLTDVYVRRVPNFDDKLDELESLLSDPKIKKYKMHGNHDVHSFNKLFMRFRGYKPLIRRYVMDIQAAANLIDENVYKMPDLTLIQKTFTDFKGDYKREFKESYDKEDMLGTLTKHPDEYRFYAIADSDVTRRAGVETMRPWFLEHPRQANYLAKMVMPSLQTLAVMEENGALIDREKLPEVTEQVADLMAEAQAAAFRHAPREVLRAHENAGLKLTRDRLVADILFDDDGFGLEVLKRTKGKDPCIDKEVRMLLLDRPLRKAVREFIEQYNLYSEYQTMHSRYLKGFERHIKCDGRVHTHYSLCTAVTGRTTSSDPNMQNNPKRSRSADLIRQLIIAPPGYNLLAVDESQAELRWAADRSGDPEMIRIFRDGKLDIHTETARSLVREMGLKWEKLTGEDHSMYRRNAKAINFGLLFLMSLPGFIRYAKKEYGIDLNQKQGQMWIDLFFGKYRRLPTYHRKMIDLVRRQGYVEHCLGRIRRLPEIHSKDVGLRLEAERMAVNQPIQGPSSDTVLLAGNEVMREDFSPEELRPCLFIHDELIYEVKEEYTEQYARMIKDHMEHPPLQRDFGVELSVPLVADVKVGKNLAEMHELTLN